MKCINGRVDPDQNTKYKLFASCGGFCQNPRCGEPLFKNYKKKYVHIAEMAHVIAATEGGPRSNANLDADERSKFENLIMLCPKCHTIIDKSVDDYPIEVLRSWKNQHEAKIKEQFGVQTYNTRDDARRACVRIMRANKIVLDTYGPNGPERYNPESSQPRIWTQKILSEILPNNQAIIQLCKQNEHLLSEKEMSVVEVFNQHTKDLTLRHLHGERMTAIRYPIEMDDILKDI